MVFRQVSVAVSVGGTFTCALTTAGQVSRVGAVDRLGQLGDGRIDSRPQHGRGRPLRDSQRGIVQIASGARNTRAPSPDGGVRCWGWNGRRADDDLAPCRGRTTARRADDERGDHDADADRSARAIPERESRRGSTADHSCAITSDGAVWCLVRNKWPARGRHHHGPCSCGPGLEPHGCCVGDRRVRITRARLSPVGSASRLLGLRTTPASSRGRRATSARESARPRQDLPPVVVGRIVRCRADHGRWSFPHLAWTTWVGRSLGNNEGDRYLFLTERQRTG